MSMGMTALGFGCRLLTLVALFAGATLAVQAPGRHSHGPQDRYNQKGNTVEGSFSETKTDTEEDPHKDEKDAPAGFLELHRNIWQPTYAPGPHGEQEKFDKYVDGINTVKTQSSTQAQWKVELPTEITGLKRPASVTFKALPGEPIQAKQAEMQFYVVERIQWLPGEASAYVYKCDFVPFGYWWSRLCQWPQYIVEYNITENLQDPEAKGKIRALKDKTWPENYWPEGHYKETPEPSRLRVF